MKIRGQEGFSLVELTIAMAVFSFMLLIVSKGFLQVLRVQQAGVASRNTQQNARLIMEQMTREARSAFDVHIQPGIGSTQTICMVTAGGLSEYYVVLVSGIPRLYRGTRDYNSGYVAGVCQPPTATQVLSSANVKVVDLSGLVTNPVPVAGEPAPIPSLNMTIKLASATGQLDASGLKCDAGFNNQFCSVTSLTSSISLRGPK